LPARVPAIRIRAAERPPRLSGSHASSKRTYGPQTPGRAVGAFIVRGSKSESLTRFYVIVRAGGKEFAGNQPEPVLKFLRSRRRT
jgi:hypothetical protein